jgi:FkbM family methyltransferase
VSDGSAEGRRTPYWTWSWRSFIHRRLRRIDHVPDARLAGGTLFEISRLRTHPRSENEAIIRSLCRNAFLGNATSLCSVLGRYRMFVDSEDIGLSVHLLMDGYWEMWTTEAMARFVKPGMMVADIGANLGYFAVLLGELVGPAGWVHAFEPNPAIATLLRRSVNINVGQPRTTVHEVALWDHDGEAVLRVPHLEPKNATLTNPHESPENVPVQVRRLDSYPELHNLDFIKIDVEGAEEATWRGMHALLGSGRPLTILLEFQAIRYQDPGAFIDLMLSSGFSLSLVTQDKRLVALDKESLLALAGHQDQMLLLRR